METHLTFYVTKIVFKHTGNWKMRPNTRVSFVALTLVVSPCVVHLANSWTLPSPGMFNHSQKYVSSEVKVLLHLDFVQFEINLSL